MGGPGSGGNNMVSIAEHVRRGTYRMDRHGGRSDPPPAPPLSTGDRKRTLAGLGTEARRVAAALLDEFEWDTAGLVGLRLYAQSCERLAGFLDNDERRRETRTMLSLLKSLSLERGK